MSSGHVVNTSTRRGHPHTERNPRHNQKHRCGGKGEACNPKKQRMDPFTNMEDMAWGKNCFTLPKAVHATDDTAKKHAFLDQTAKAIREHPTATWMDKVAIFDSRFKLPMTKTQGEPKLAQLKTPTANCCRWQHLRATTRNGTNINIPANVAASVNFNDNAACIETEVTISPIVAMPTLTTAPPPATKLVSIAVPKTHAPDGTPTIAHGLTQALLRNPLAMMTTATTAGETIRIGKITQGDDFAETEFTKFQDKTFHNTLFEHMAELFVEQFAGQGMRIDAPARLRAITQTKCTPSGGVHKASIDNLLQEIMAEARTLPQDQPCPVQLPQIFHDALTPENKQLLANEAINVPATVGVTNMQMLETLNDFATQVKRATKRADTIVEQTPKRAGTSTRSATRNATFMATHESSETWEDQHHTTFDQIEFSDDPCGSNTMFCTTAPGEPLPDAMAADVMCTGLLEEWEQEAQQHQLHAFFQSPANAALEKASGTLCPPQCFGCSNSEDPEIRKDCFHPWRECKRRHNPEAARATQKGMRECIEKKNQRRRACMAQNWQQLGHHNNEEANIMQDIASNSTSPKERKILITKLQQTMTTEPNRSISCQDQWRQDTNGAAFGATFGSTNDQHPSNRACFLSTMLKCLHSAQQNKRRFQTRCSEKLPHIRLPVGEDSKTDLQVACDTCAAMNMGHKVCHQAICGAHPNLAEEHIEFDEQGFQHFEIGGAGDGGTPAVIDAAIKHKTPFRHQGEPVKWMFALSNNLTANSIIGTPMIVQLKVRNDFASGTASSELLAASFNMVMATPNRTERPPNQIADGRPPFKQTLLSNKETEPRQEAEPQDDDWHSITMGGPAEPEHS